MIRTCNDSNGCTRYYRTPRCAGLCLPVPPSAYKIPNQSLEKYSGVLAPTSSMLFLARSMSYRTSHVLSIVELFTQSEMQYTPGLHARTVQALAEGNCVLTRLSLPTYLARFDIFTISSLPNRTYGSRTHVELCPPHPCVRSRTSGRLCCL